MASGLFNPAVVPQNNMIKGVGRKISRGGGDNGIMAKDQKIALLQIKPLPGWGWGGQQ